MMIIYSVGQVSELKEMIIYSDKLVSELSMMIIFSVGYHFSLLIRCLS